MVKVHELNNGLHSARIKDVRVCSDRLEPCTSRRLPSREIDCSQLSGTALAIYFESDNDLGLHRCVRLEARTSMCSCLGKQVVVAIAVDRRVLGVPLPHCPDRTAAGQSGSSSVSPHPRWQVQLCAPCSSSSSPNFLTGQRPPSSTPTPSISSAMTCVCACARVVSFLSDRFAPPLCGLCLEFGAHIGRSRCLRAKLRPVV